MKKTTFIIGHKNPDTDSIASALAYADLKTQLNEDVTPRRLGPLNEETKFATRYFDIEAPMFMADARTQIKDLDIDKAEIILSSSSCNDAFKRIIKTNNRTLCVVDDLAKPILKGIVSIGDLASIRMNNKNKRNNLLKKTNLKILTKDLAGHLVVKTDGFINNGQVKIVTSLKANQDYRNAILIVDNEALVKNLIIEGSSLIVLSCDRFNAEDILNAKDKVALIESKLSIMEIMRVIYEAFPVKEIMSKKIITYNREEFTEDVANRVSKTRFRSYPVIDEKGIILGQISRYHLFSYHPKKFILVDHSSRIQSIDYIDKAEVVEIIDHHHIGDIQTNRPIFYRNQKCGCTCSIIYSMYKENNLLPPPKIAGMMLSAIISDTLHFKSETTTQMDKDNAKELANIAGVDIDKYAMELLNASVNLMNADVEDIITSDLKVYHFNNYHLAVGQTNYSDLGDIQIRLNEFEEVLQKKREANKFDLIVMMFTHVLGEGTMFMFYGPLSNIMFEVIETKIDNHRGFDHYIISRKQQLIPKLSDVING